MYSAGEKGPARNPGEPFSGTLLPGEEMTAVFRIGQEDKGALWAADAAQAPLLWRIQLRRGLVALGATEVSATTVIGVEFRPRAIVNETGEVARRPLGRFAGQRSCPSVCQTSDWT